MTIDFDPADIRTVTPEEQRARLQALAAMPEPDDIDCSDIPVMDEGRWNRAVKINNPWMNPSTKSLIERVWIDSDIILWIMNQVGEEGCREKMNAMLRKAMEEERRSPA